MTHGIREAFTYRKRHEHGTQHPLDTLQTRSGTCRDYALFMIEALRRLGIAARFVSGYLFIPGDRAHGYVGGGSTHAWVQVYLPSAGWIEFDPTNGIVGTRDLMRVAVARDPRQAIPLHGTYLGSADAFVGMDVSINVVSVGRGGERPDHGNQGGLRDRLRRRAADADGDHAQHSPLALCRHRRHRKHRRRAECADRLLPRQFRQCLRPAGGACRRRDACAAARWCAIPDCPTSSMPTAQQIPIDQLPDDVLLYLMASRYCETDKLTDIAWSLFGQHPAGLGAGRRRSASFVHNHVTFGYQHAHHMKSAHDVYEQGAGVCRDFAHLALTFCRCMNIPARYCTGYMGDIGIPPDPAPMDFSGWFEVYLSGQWYTFDARHNHPRIGRILMGTGRDAADVALTTSFGRMDLVKFLVISDEVVAA